MSGFRGKEITKELCVVGEVGIDIWSNGTLVKEDILEG
jgi:hypothetical protein